MKFKKLYMYYRRCLRILFAMFIAKPFCNIWLGLNIRNIEHLPSEGPAILIANHNSHLDTVALLSLFKLSCIYKVRPVAAADYFFKNKVLSWVATRLFGIIALNRVRCEGLAPKDPLEPCYKALRKNQILIIFPEGSRGEAETFQDFKKGIFHLHANFPETPVIPIYMQGLGKAMPKGDWFVLPVFADIYIGNKVEFKEDKNHYMEEIKRSFIELKEQHGRNPFYGEEQHLGNKKEP